jgi:rfaE bifunctional protein kinase chain/domain
MTQTSIDEIFKKFNSLKALVVGDVMVDAYIWGKVERISPEAPVPVVRVTQRENRLGGAANVALNLAALGAKPIICAVCGNDPAGAGLKELLWDQNMSLGGLVPLNGRPTTVKTRIISSHQHIVRIDEESLTPLNAQEENQFLKAIEKVVDHEAPDVIIFEDYNKGLLTPKVIEQLIALAAKKGIPTAVDPKKDNFFAYKDVTMFKPNLKELVEGLKVEIPKTDHEALENAVTLLEERIGNKISLITLSEEGVYVRKDGESQRIPAHLRKIADVSGAGDTVISVASLCLAQGVDVGFMASLANLAGGLVCEKVGVVPIEKETLLAEAKKHLGQL